MQLCYEKFNSGEIECEVFDLKCCYLFLLCVYYWVDGSVYVNYVELVC